ncbi:MAG: DUF72 domain-containing protein [Chloroflexia bacterium]
MVAPIDINNRRIWIGCSGYVYKHWRGVFYPQDLPESKWLSHYAQYFPTVELNNTHYILPSEQTFEGWRERSPEGFLFAVKASRFLTHMKKLKDPQEPLARLFERAELLGPKLGPVLYQLPPRWYFNPERLQTFLEALPAGYQHALEVREPGWLNPEFFSMLEQHSVAFCLASLPHYQTPVQATAPFVYIRFHGSGEMYYYNYTPEELTYWRDIILGFAREGRDVYAYFNNDPNAWAVANALELTRLISEAR